MKDEQLEKAKRVLEIANSTREIPTATVGQGYAILALAEQFREFNLWLREESKVGGCLSKERPNSRNEN